MPKITAVTLAILIAALQGYSSAQSGSNQIVIRVRSAATESKSKESSIPYQNGFRSAISGQTIDYHSSDPDVDSALIVRGQTNAPTISWRTDPASKASGGYYHFIWLAGIESKGFAQEEETHEFKLFVNRQPWFTFRNAKDASARSWKMTGKDGAELSFASLLTDTVGDLFGYMQLKVPEKDVEAGKPLTLEIRGDNSGSADWCMTFQHPFDFIAQLRAEPALLREAGNSGHSSQLLRLSLDNLVEGRSIKVLVPNQAPVSAQLRIGSNAIQLRIPAVSSETTLPIRFELNDQLVNTSVLRVMPVKRRDVYLLSYSHNDIGYTDLQPDVEKKQWNNLEVAMRLIRQTRDYPENARYKWNLETIWSLESYLKKATPAQREEVFADVHEGSIGLSALYANMLTGLANSVEMSHFFDFARTLRADYHIPMTTAVTSDVPGFSWGLVSALAQSGVKYFATAPNNGDRIGYTLQAWGDKPFYWVSQSGEEKVLTWMAGASYSSFHEGTLAKLGDQKMMKLMRKLDEESYPYAMVQLPYTLADNGPPDPTLSDFVKQWNERYVSPRLIIATHAQMFQEFEKRYGPTLPVVKGDFTPYWEDGAASTAYETALNRAAVDRLIQGEALWSMLSPSSYPAQDYNSAWRNVTFYDEHTWGAHNSIEEPDLPFVKQQWEFKRNFALDADRESRELIQRALPVVASSRDSRTAIDIYNTNSWPRTDVVYLTPALSAAGDRVTDLNGKPLPSQRLSTGELAVLLETVLPFAATRIFVEKGEAFNASGALQIHGHALENEYVSLSVDSATGAVNSLKLKRDGTELVDRARPGLDEYLYVSGTDGSKAQRISNVRVRVKESGSLVDSLLVEGDAPGAKRYSSEIRLVQGIPRVDLITNIDKLAIREKEGVHIAFPFSIPRGQLRYDVADGVVRPELDQLMGACKNFFSVQSWVDVSNQNYGVTWASTNAPLIEVGAITAEQPWMKSIAPSTSIYSYVMNNYWHTNYKADQEGPVTFSYSVSPHAGFSALDAAIFGIERREPLVVAPADAASPPFAPLLRLSSSQVLVSSVKPIAGGRSWLLYLYNPTDQLQKFTLEWRDRVPISIHDSDAAGRLGHELRDLKIIPYDSAYLRVDRSGGD